MNYRLCWDLSEKLLIYTYWWSSKQSFWASHTFLISSQSFHKAIILPCSCFMDNELGGVHFGDFIDGQERVIADEALVRSTIGLPCHRKVVIYKIICQRPLFIYSAPQSKSKLKCYSVLKNYLEIDNYNAALRWYTCTHNVYSLFNDVYNSRLIWKWMVSNLYFFYIWPG